MSLGEPFTFYVTEQKMNDGMMGRNIDVLEGGSGPRLMFRASYTPPYEEFSLIRSFQRRSAYRPFRDEAKKEKIAVVYLSEWIGHENEEYLEAFVKFLHDYRAFFHFTYYFVAEEVKEKEARSMYQLLASYLGEGKVVACRQKKREGKEGGPNEIL